MGSKNAIEILRHREIHGHGPRCSSATFSSSRAASTTRLIGCPSGRRGWPIHPQDRQSWMESWRDSTDLTLRLDRISTLHLHNGCVNSVVWSPDGRYLLSGSDDRCLVISDPFDPVGRVIRNIPSGHRSNIFSARFLPCTDNRYIVSCSSDGTVMLTDVERPDTYGKFTFTCHVSNTYEVGTIPGDAHSFLSCGEDGCVRLFDRRLKTSCGPCKDDVILSSQRSICALDIHPVKSYLMVVGCSDSSAKLYDMRMLSKPSPDPEGLVGLQSIFVMPTADSNSRNRRITSVDFSPDGKNLLISFSSDFVYLYSLQEYSNDPVNFEKGCLEGDDTMSVKRVRLRGDWSDTGPQAMPEPSGEEREGEGEEERDVGTSDGGGERVEERGEGEGGRRAPNILQRFGGLLTRWFERQLTEEEAGEEGGPDNEQAERQREGEEDEGNQDENLPHPPDEDETLEESMAEESSLSGVDLRMRAMGGQGSSTSTMRVVLADSPSPSPPPQPHQGLEEDGGERRREEGESLALRVRRGLGRQRREREESHPSTSQIDNDREARRRRVVALMEKEAKKRQEKKLDLLRHLQTFPQHKCVGVYRGHRNARTMVPLKQACFWGKNHIMSGSDCGHFFLWNRHNAQVEMVVEADKHVVNCLQPHPTLPLLATSGIDYDVKLWAPISPQSKVDTAKLKDLMRRNEVMLAETRDTVTIPAAFMIRMIANINRARNERRRQELMNRADNEGENSQDPQP